MAQRSNRRRVILLALLGATVAISAPIALGFLSHLHPAFDSFAHLRAHLAVLMALLSVPLLLAGLRLEALGALVLGIGAFVTVSDELGLRGGGERPEGEGARAVYSLIHLNLRYDNSEPERVLSMIARERPDILLLNETDAIWRERFDLLEMAYPYRIFCEPVTRFAVAILSRRPFVGEPSCGPRGWFAAARVDLAGRTVAVAAVHLGWPWPWRQAAQVAALPRLLPDDETMVLGGDLNATPWSATVEEVAAAGGFTRAPGLGPTWLDRRLPESLIPRIGIQIDHVMWRGRIADMTVERLDGVGSDHLPLRARFTVAPRVEPEDGLLHAGLSAP